jgi:P-type Cu+ transporter
LAENIEELESEGKTVAILCVNKVPRLLFSMEEEHLAKTDAKKVVHYLTQTLGLKVMMVTGDNQYAAQKVASFLGITDVVARASPF